MAADSAVSTTYEGVPYRVQNEEDHEKVITHLEHLIFCSGNLERCRVLRQYIRSLEKMDYEAISQFAQKLWNGQEGDDSTGILICAPDNSLVGMLSYQQFEVKELPWNKDGLDIDTLGFRMKEAYQAACSAAKDSKDWTGPVLAAFSATACEEVGGVLHIFSRMASNDKITELKVPGPQPKNMRSGVFVPLTQTVYAMHAIVQANQFLDKNGKDMFTSDGKIAGEYIDARGITIKDAQGNDVVYFDETGIHWNKAYSPR